MSRSPQFTLRELFVLITLAAVLFGTICGFARLVTEAHREAIRQAVNESRIQHEDNSRERP